MTEYLLDLNEKWMVREVDICSFRGVLRKKDGLGVKRLTGEGATMFTEQKVNNKRKNSQF